MRGLFPVVTFIGVSSLFLCAPVALANDVIEAAGRYPKVDPSICFIGAKGRPEWVVVRSARYPSTIAPRPSNWDTLSKSCARISGVGHFAMVAIASADQPRQSNNKFVVVLWRGYGMHVRFEGLQ